MRPLYNFQPYFRKLYSNIIFQSTPRYSEWPAPFRHFSSLACLPHYMVSQPRRPRLEGAHFFRADCGCGSVGWHTVSGGSEIYWRWNSLKAWGKEKLATHAYFPSSHILWPSSYPATLQQVASAGTEQLAVQRFLSFLSHGTSNGPEDDPAPILVSSYEGVSKSFRTGRLERELQMVLLSATRCSCIAILWACLVSFAAITLCVAAQRVFITVVYFVIDSVRKLLDTPSYIDSAYQMSSAVPMLFYIFIAFSMLWTEITRSEAPDTCVNIVGVLYWWT
jgi:hypothetical protein